MGATLTQVTNVSRAEVDVASNALWSAKQAQSSVLDLVPGASSGVAGDGLVLDDNGEWVIWTNLATQFELDAATTTISNAFTNFYSRPIATSFEAHFNTAWGQGGWLKEMGVLDFAGGTVVHIAAGFSALAFALVIGPRKGFGKFPM